MAVTYYGDLGVSPAATPEEIKKAYRALASQHHPDRGGDHATMAVLTVAYEVLSHERKRPAYDEQLELLGTKCGTCEGAGVRYRQKGFTARVATPCKPCNGEGYTAVKALNKTFRMGGDIHKKRRGK